MNNLKYYPFERNHYFYGKLLTAADFVAEQNYINDKRRFINRALFGSGIVTGLGIRNIDNGVMIESGFAIDAYGREILVDQTAVQKLSAIEGYEQIGDGMAYLCIRYQEEAVDKVYSLKSQESNVQDECSRVREGYSLFLTQEAPVLETDFKEGLIQKHVLLENEQAFVILRLPGFVPAGETMKLFLEIRRYDINIPLELKLVLHTPYLLNEQGEQITSIRYHSSDHNLAEETIAYSFTVEKTHPGRSKITLLKENIYIKVGSKVEEQQEEKNIPVYFVWHSIQEEVERRQRAIGFPQTMATAPEAICLAKLYVYKDKKSYAISRVIENPFGQNAYTTYAAAQNNKILEYFRQQGKTVEKVIQTVKPREVQKESRPENEIAMAEGSLEIVLGYKPKTGKCYFSEEIPHGLGIGMVSIEAAVEEKGDLEEGGAKNSITFGDTEIFKGTAHELKMPGMKLGIKCYGRKGTFVVGVKLLEASSVSAVTIRWFARKVNTKTKRKEEAGIKFYIEPGSIVIKPREELQLRVYLDRLRFTGEDSEAAATMEEDSVIWELTEKESGSITRSGLYTAPSSPGLYTVKASLASDRNVAAYAVVIVK